MSIFWWMTKETSLQYKGRMKHNKPVTLTDREIDALSIVAAAYIVRAVEHDKDCRPLVSAVRKIEESRQRREIEIPEERLRVLDG